MRTCVCVRVCVCVCNHSPPSLPRGLLFLQLLTSRHAHTRTRRREANNAATFAAQMAAAGVSGVTVAPVRRDLSSDCVLVTEWVDGEKLSESGAADVRELCNTLLNAYLIQLLDTGGRGRGGREGGWEGFARIG